MTKGEAKVRAQVLRDTAHRLLGAMVARATDGMKDGDLVKQFDEAKEHARERGVDGERLLAAALGKMLVDQATEAHEALLNEAARLEAGASAQIRTKKQRAT